jgi:glycosyltransferase involved in cell wall biosynthesis
MPKKKSESTRSKIAFVWQGVSNEKIFNQWNDGLREAVRILSKKYDISFHEPWQDISGVDVILYWEAPCTINGSNAPHYNKVRQNTIKKALLFAGGPIQKEWVDGFNIVCVESKINFDEFSQLGVEVYTAFGINDKVMKPKKLPKKWKAIHHGTSASWKRQWLLGEAFGADAIVVGRHQKEDPYPFDKCKECGSTVIEESGAEDICDYLNQSHVLVQSADYWGGGQRATLEAMSCGIPVVCMTDSPKNREYIEESGAGLIVEPSIGHIKTAVADIIENWSDEEKARGIAYVQSKWTAQHYADSLDFVIKKLSN